MISFILSREERIKEWDVFRLTTWESSHEAMEVIYALFRQLFKIVTYGVMFILCFCLTILNKASLLLVTSQVRHNSDLSLECKTCHESHDGEIQALQQCVALPYNYSRDYDKSCLCTNPANGTTIPTETKSGQMCDVMILQWIWCLIFIQCTPYVFVFLRNIWIVSFRRKKAPTADTMLFVSPQSSHTHAIFNRSL